MSDNVTNWTELREFSAVDLEQSFVVGWEAEGESLLIDLDRAGIKTVIWATGFRPDYSWLDLPVLDRKGYIRHDGGVVDDAPGMYLMGMQFLRRRKSTLIDGVGDDARDLSAHLVSYLDTDKSSSRPPAQAIS